jgi:ankyrin repeat protein
LTALHLSAFRSNNRIVKKLLNRGASKKVIDAKGMSPKDVADEMGDVNVA